MHTTSYHIWASITLLMGVALVWLAKVESLDEPVPCVQAPAAIAWEFDASGIPRIPCDPR